MLSLFFFEQYPRIIYLRWRMHRETGCLSEPERVWSEHTVVGCRWRATTIHNLSFHAVCALCGGRSDSSYAEVAFCRLEAFCETAKILPLKRLQQKETR